MIPGQLICTRALIVTSAPVYGVARNSPRMRLCGEVHVAIVSYRDIHSRALARADAMDRLDVVPEA